MDKKLTYPLKSLRDIVNNDLRDEGCIQNITRLKTHLTVHSEK